MTFIFYLLAIPAFLYHLTRIGWSKHSQKKNTILKLQQQFPKFQYWNSKKREKVIKEKDLDPVDQKIITDYAHEAILVFLYFVWLIVGIFSSQWILFIAIILVIFLPTKFLSSTFLNGVFYNLGMLTKHIILACLVFAIIINKYHLHINLLDLLIKYFQ